jgi:hypothetical protein
VKLRVLDIARAARSKAKPGREKLNRAYGQLLSSTSRVVGQAKRFAAEIAGAVKGASDVRKQLALRWFRNGRKWRTGCEGRIGVIKRRHGLNRCRTKGDAGMARWVGLGVFADTLITIGRAMAKRSSA